MEIVMILFVGLMVVGIFLFLIPKMIMGATPSDTVAQRALDFMIYRSGLPRGRIGERSISVLQGWMAEDIPLRARALGRKRDEVALEIAARVVSEIDAIDRLGDQGALPDEESLFGERRTVIGALRSSGSPMVQRTVPAYRNLKRG